MTREQIEEAAAQWIVRREEPQWSADDEHDLRAWLAASMAHKAAFWRLEQGWRAADRIGALGDGVPPRRTLRARGPMIAAGVSALAAAIALVIGFGPLRFGIVGTPAAATQRVATALGGRTQMALADDSRIELNTATLLRANVTARHREVWLDRGEAYFDVKHSETIPFVVHAGTRTVTVLGTRFSIRRQGDLVDVRVLKGRVRVDEVRQDGSQGASSTVITGDIAIGRGGSTLVTSGASRRIERALAWRDGRIEFDATPLSAAADEFNRYNAKKLVIGDVDTANTRIGGTFRTSNVDGFARLLHDAYGLTVTDGEREIRVSR